MDSPVDINLHNVQGNDHQEMEWPVIKAILRLGGVLLYEHKYPIYSPEPGKEGADKPWVEEVRLDPEDATRVLMTEKGFYRNGPSGGGVLAELDQWMDNKRFRLP